MIKKSEMSEKDLQAAYSALSRWFDSQGINMTDGSWLCIQAAGLSIGLLAKDQAHFERGIKILSAGLRSAAKRAYTFKCEQEES